MWRRGQPTTNEVSMAKLRMNQAIAEAMRREMTTDPTVMLMGEDVGAAQGVFKTSEGLMAEFGPLRVRDTPISEMGFLGAGVGAAATGLRPIVEIMFVEFLGVALDQLVTEATRLRYLSAGRYKAPLVVRASVGAGGGFGAQHSQTLENWFAATPGLTVCEASGARTAYGLLRSAVRSEDPVLLLEPRALYGVREEVDPDATTIPLGRAEVVASGHDVTIVALGQTVGVAREAAEAADWSADVIDLLTIQPWDRRTVLASVERTGRLVVVEEAPYSGGWGAGIVAEAATRLYGALRAAPFRITAPDVPVPFGKHLEQHYIPSADRVASEVDVYLSTGVPPEPWWEGINA